MSTEAKYYRLLVEQDRRRSARDPVYWVTSHCQIETPADGWVRFGLWPAQQELLAAMHRDRASLILKTRRIGASWLGIAYALWILLHEPGSHVGVVCHTTADAKDLLHRLRGMYDRLSEDPVSRHYVDGVTLARDAETSGLYRLSTGSSIQVAAGGQGALRGRTLRLLLVDEAAFNRDGKETKAAAVPAIEGGGQAIITSTGNGRAGRGGWFYDLWTEATTGDGSEWTPHFLPWSARPDRGGDWYDRTLATVGSEDVMRREYPATPDDAFVSPDLRLVYPTSEVAAATRREPPELETGDTIHEGVDWGYHTHLLWGVETERGGIHVLREMVTHDEPAEVARATVGVWRARYLEQVPGQCRYDAAGRQSQATYVAVRQSLHSEIPPSRAYKVPFGKVKTIGINWLRMAFRSGLIGIDAAACPVLVTQLQQYHWTDPDKDRTVKTDDHGCDALVALVAPLALRWHEATRADHG